MLMAKKSSKKVVKKSTKKSTKVSSKSNVKSVSKSTHLFDFYGTECPHCIEMMPMIAEVEKETGRKIQRLEVWHNSENQKKFMAADKGRCGGVPFFWNSKTDKFICGATSKDKLKAWAMDK